MICGCPSRGNGDSHGADLAPLQAPSPPRPPQRGTPRSSGQGLTRSAHAATPLARGRADSRIATAPSTPPVSANEARRVQLLILHTASAVEPRVPLCQPRRTPGKGVFWVSVLGKRDSQARDFLDMARGSKRCREA